MFECNILKPFIENSFLKKEKEAFCIQGKDYKYSELIDYISSIRVCLKIITGRAVGLVPNDDILTYASIMAIWMEGKYYVPLHPSWPIDRCDDVISQVDIKYVLDSSNSPRGYKNNPQIINTSHLTGEENFDDSFVECDDSDIAYILFTSGSTGRPKGVPISRGNLAAFVQAVWGMGIDINENDRCLQCFELTFDLSVFSYLIPLLKGACVYTVPSNVIKYSHIAELLEDYELTVALMAPSTINYLRPYFEEIEVPSLRYGLFCGEALHEDVTSEWARCVPNARILNVYGPTENTIFCTYYEYQRNGLNKSHNGVLSIGQSMRSGDVAIVDEEGKDVHKGELGELVLHGKQLFNGYWKNDAKTKEVFLVRPDGKAYYKSGDLCFYDEDGDIMYSGRKDFQAKIQGFRVELGEIEHHAREILKDINVVCVAYENNQNLTEIAMFIESVEFDTADLLSKMRDKMPSYMIPSKLLFEPSFPLNINGKIDRKTLKSRI